MRDFLGAVAGAIVVVVIAFVLLAMWVASGT